MKKIVCLTFVLMIVLAFIGCSEQKSDNTETDNTATTDRFIVVYSDFNNAIYADYVMTKRLSGCVYHKDTGMFEVAMIQVSGKSAVYYVAPENLTLINMTNDIDKMGE